MCAATPPESRKLTETPLVTRARSYRNAVYLHRSGDTARPRCARPAAVRSTAGISCESFPRYHAIPLASRATGFSAGPALPGIPQVARSALRCLAIVVAGSALDSAALLPVRQAGSLWPSGPGSAVGTSLCKVFYALAHKSLHNKKSPRNKSRTKLMYISGPICWAVCGIARTG
jgi:hypothetical protein